MSTVNNMQIQDDEGNVFHPETSIEQIVGENGTQVFPGGKPGNMESSDMTTAFTESKMRENIKSGEKHIKKRRKAVGFDGESPSIFHGFENCCIFRKVRGLERATHPWWRGGVQGRGQ